MTHPIAMRMRVTVGDIVVVGCGGPVLGREGSAESRADVECERANAPAQPVGGRDAMRGERGGARRGGNSEVEGGRWVGWGR